jgi:hypothetical protein
MAQPWRGNRGDTTVMAAPRPATARHGRVRTYVRVRVRVNQNSINEHVSLFDNNKKTAAAMVTPPSMTAANHDGRQS